MSFPGQDTARIVCTIALALFSGLSEMGVKLAAEVAVVPDISVDSGVTNEKDAVDAKPAGDLLRAPIQAQQAGDDLEL